MGLYNLKARSFCISTSSFPIRRDVATVCNQPTPKDSVIPFSDRSPGLTGFRLTRALKTPPKSKNEMAPSDLDRFPGSKWEAGRDIG